MAKNKSSSNILTWGNPYSSPLNVKESPQGPIQIKSNSPQVDSFRLPFSKKESKKVVKFTQEDQQNKPHNYSTRVNALEEAIRSNSRKRFEHVSHHQENNENKNPNHYSMPNEDNPLTNNTQMSPTKPVKTAGSYIPKKKRADKPTCILREEEMTKDDIKIRDLKDSLMDMQINRDMLQDRLNQLALKTN